MRLNCDSERSSELKRHRQTFRLTCATSTLSLTPFAQASCRRDSSKHITCIQLVTMSVLSGSRNILSSLARNYASAAKSSAAKAAAKVEASKDVSVVEKKDWKAVVIPAKTLESMSSTKSTNMPGASFLNDLRATSGLGMGDGITSHTGKWLQVCRHGSCCFCPKEGLFLCLHLSVLCQNHVAVHVSTVRGISDYHASGTVTLSLLTMCLSVTCPGLWQVTYGIHPGGQTHQSQRDRGCFTWL